MSHCTAAAWPAPAARLMGVVPSSRCRLMAAMGSEQCLSSISATRSLPDMTADMSGVTLPVQMVFGWPPFSSSRSTSHGRRCDALATVGGSRVGGGGRLGAGAHLLHHARRAAGQGGLPGSDTTPPRVLSVACKGALAGRRGRQLGASGAVKRCAQSRASSPHAAACTSGKLEQARAPVMQDRTRSLSSSYPPSISPTSPRMRSRSSGESASACLMSIKFCSALVMSEFPCSAARGKERDRGGLGKGSGYAVPWSCPNSPARRQGGREGIETS
eukprot:scaffold16219_cov102-Isochrysis_galbana.AAC.8